MALDLSERRCGIVIFEAQQGKIRELEVFHIRTRKGLLYHVEKIIKENNIQKVVFGISKNSKGEIPPRFFYIKDTAHSLFQKTKIPYVLINEYQSTILAKEKRKNLLLFDSAAASIILKTFMKDNN